MDALDSHKNITPDDTDTVRYASPMPHVSGVLPPSYFYLHLPSAFAREALLYAVYIGRYFCDDRYMFKRERFDYYCCHIIDQGTLYAVIDGKEYAVPERSMYIYDNKKQVCIYAKGETSFRHFTIGGQGASALCNRIIATRGNCIDAYDFMVVDNALNALLALAEFLSPDSASASLPSQAVARAIQYIESRFGDDLSVPEIAAAAHYSEHYFSKIFKEATGLSTHAYLRKVRLAFAVELLSITTLTVNEIAKKCGFSYPKILSTVLGNSITALPINIGGWYRI